MTPSLLALSAVATLLLPFMIGWWIGHPAFAAAAFLALGVTLVIHQLRLDEPAPLAGMATASLLSALAAGAGGALRERRRGARPPSPRPRV